jgi:hypothetical protein
MITFRITTDVKDDRRVVLTLPPEVPTGQAELEVSVGFPAAEKARTGQADWLEVQAETNGLGQARYPLRGSVVRYEQPTEPVAEADWETLR